MPTHPLLLTFSPLVAFCAVVVMPLSARAEIDPTTKAKLDRWVEVQRETASLEVTFRQVRQLRTIKRPLISEGRMWWQRDAGFRWEVGDPPKLILIQDAEGRVAELDPPRRKAKLKSREQANEEMHGLGFGFSTFFDADPAGWEGKLKLLSCHPADSDPDQIVATFGFLEKKIATAVRKMIVVADTRRGDLREFMLMFRDKSSILLRFHPMKKNSRIDPSHFTINLEGYAIKEE